MVTLLTLLCNSSYLCFKFHVYSVIYAVCTQNIGFTGHFFLGEKKNAVSDTGGAITATE